MEKKLAGLLGAVGALVVSAPGQATPVQPSDSVMQANSYSDLLKPIPNAAEVLRGLQGQPEAKV
ncbi:MAG: hypothetical protein JOZ05_13235, partial [Acetobacteraceae bacterium]|nr:hypothetical protein [Acetobacteraceae bacterium]